MNFPTYLIFRTIPGLEVTTCETVEEVTNHLQGQNLQYYAVFKHGKRVDFEDLSIHQFQEKLENNIGEPVWSCPTCNAIHEGKMVHCDECGQKFDELGNLRSR
jgi:hypothetical protein